MMLSLQKNAPTTPAIWAKIAVLVEPAFVLTAHFGVTIDTIYCWRGRTGFEDRSHTADQLATTFTPARGKQSRCLAAQGTCKAAQVIQEPRAWLFASGREIPATDGLRDSPTLSFRRHRPRH